MRVERIRLNNLNSLYGRWEIDLTQRDYQDDGLFAIVGPTGSGKTTILDALCLALFGRTPRLSQVSRTENEIMSRKAFECSAEVIFRTQEGRYLCQWEQNRAYKRSDGALQAARHFLSKLSDDITDLSDGQILESKTTEVKEAVKRITGLDYNRFIRSTLLAQGAFAAFLEAEESVRSDILEKITGTEIYSEISRKTRERFSAEKKEYELKSASLESIKLLTQEEESEIKNLASLFKSQLLDFESQIEINNRALIWREGLEKLENELKQLDERERGLNREIEEFKPLKDRYNLALKAVELEGDYLVLISRRSERDKERSALAMLTAEAPKLNRAAQEAKRALEEATNNLKGLEESLEKASPKFREVRVLDVTINEVQKNADSRLEALNKFKNQIEKLQMEIENQNKTLKRKKEEEGELNLNLSQSQADEALTELIPILNERAQDLNKKENRLGERKREANLRLKALERLEKELEISREVLKKRAESLEELKRAKSELELTMAALYRYNNRAQLGENVEQLTLVANNVNQGLSVIKDLSAIDLKTKQISQKRESLALKLSELSELLLSREAILEEKEKNLIELERVALLKINLENLSQLRSSLVEGESCPLCGSLQHPYAQNLPKLTEGSEQNLKQAKSETRQAAKELEAMRLEIAKREKELELSGTLIAEIESRREPLINQLRELSESLNLTMGANLESDISKLREQKAKEQAELKSLIAQIDNGEEELKKLSKRLEVAIEEVGQLDKELKKGEALFQNETNLAQVAQGEVKALALEIDLVRANVSDSLSELNEKGPIDKALKSLEARRELRLNRLKRQGQLEKELASLNASLITLYERLDKEKEERASAALILERTRGELNSLKKRRVEIFGQNDPESEEKKLEGSIKEAAKVSEFSYQSVRKTELELERNRTAHNSLTESLDKRQIDIERIENNFLNCLKEYDFEGESAFCSARLSVDERNKLKEQAKELDEKAGELKTLQIDKSKSLSQERAKELTNQTREVIKEVLSQLASQKKDLTEETGRLNGRLFENERLKQDYHEAQEKLSQAKIQASRWERLDKLIGSSDGKKYRNYVQCLTFDRLTALANIHLEQMYNRYQLFHDPRKPLEALVKDSFQADEIRPTKNLSGGESFIVSLALALGLSQMAGENISVDSLFLDEGFGTLDEEALEMALSTLAGLRQEGKTIGLISHIQALTERISAKIIVNPISGGRSVLQGPGCRRLDR
ncbi:MAG: AAA family ATPase [Deltaproteobacteria bacterium]|nr:AAA family ATPase [Deltaproteobacteria bacterium]